MKNLTNTEVELKQSVAYKKIAYKENKVCLQKPIKFILYGQHSFWYFSSCLKMKNHSEEFLLPIFSKIFW